MGTGNPKLTCAGGRTFAGGDTGVSMVSVLGERIL